MRAPRSAQRPRDAHHRPPRERLVADEHRSRTAARARTPARGGASSCRSCRSRAAPSGAVRPKRPDAGDDDVVLGFVACSAAFAASTWSAAFAASTWSAAFAASTWSAAFAAMALVRHFDAHRGERAARRVVVRAAGPVADAALAVAECAEQERAVRDALVRRHRYASDERLFGRVHDERGHLRGGESTATSTRRAARS